LYKPIAVDANPLPALTWLT